MNAPTAQAAKTQGIADALAAALAPFPRVRLAHAPTPLEPMERLGSALGATGLWVKRDDCTGLAMGGNKARQLEFYFGAARAEGADTVLITGAVQSNFLRMTAAAAAKLGLACEIQHEERVAGMASDYHQSGNVLLDRMLGARMHHYPEGEDEEGADAALAARAEALRREGRRPFVIPLAASHPPLGALGYVQAAAELLTQCLDLGIEPASVIVPSGSALTHVGTLVGLRLCGSRARTVGICVRRDGKAQQARVLKRARELAAMIGRPDLIEESDVEVDDRALDGGYGRVGAATMEALLLAARLEGLLLDPVYTGKALAGLIALLRNRELNLSADTVFLHSGGTPALFGYGSVLAPLLASD